MAGVADPRIVQAVTERLLSEGWQQRGRQVRFRCPAHEDPNPSADWHLDKGTWNCLGCEAGGGAIDLARRLEIDLDSVAPRDNGAAPTRRRATGRGGSSGPGTHPAPATQPAAPLPSEEEWAKYVSQLVEHAGADPIRAREFLAELGVDPADCGWGLGRVTADIAREHRLPRGCQGTRFYIPVYHPETQSLVEVRRYAPAPFRPSDMGDGVKTVPWATGTGSAKPYRWDSLPPAGELVVLAEGELDVEVLRAMGVAAVGCTNGAGRMATICREWGHLLRGRRVALLMDNDLAGRTAAQETAAVLEEQGVAAAILSWPGERPQGWDVSDAVRRDGQEDTRTWLEWELKRVVWPEPALPPHVAPMEATSFGTWQPHIDHVLQSCGKQGGPPARIAKRELADTLSAWAAETGRLIWDQTLHGAYIADRGRAVPVAPDDITFRCLLGEAGIASVDSSSKWFIDSLERTCYSQGDRRSLQRWAASSVDDGSQEARVYLSCGETELVRATCADGKVAVDRLPNGADGVLFASDACLPAWSVSEPGIDPMTLQVFQPAIEEQEGLGYTVEMQQRLIRLWLAAMVSGQRPLPALALTGGKGSGKSTLTRAVVRLLVPGDDAAPLSEDVRDFETAMTTQLVHAIDNADGVDYPLWFPNRLATAVTGGTVKRRALYSNGQLYQARITACVTISSRDPGWARADIAERCFPVTTREWRDEERQEEWRLWPEMVEQRDAVLTWLVSRAARLLALRTTTPRSLPARFLASLAWADCQLDGQADQTTRLLGALRGAQAVVTTGGNPLLDAILHECRAGMVVRGTPTDVVKDLENAGHHLPDFGGGRAIANALRELVPSLQTLGLRVAVTSSGNATKFSIQQEPTDAELVEHDPFGEE